MKLKNVHFKNVSVATWVRIITLFVVLVNQIALSVFNVQLLPFEDEQIYEGISTMATFVVAVISAWKNNSFTDEAIEADSIMKAQKYINREKGEF